MTSKRVELTADRVAKHVCPEGKAQSFLWDSECSGFALKVAPGGSKQFIHQGRLENGRVVRVTIGSPKDWTIKDARKEARRLQTLIDNGTDPREERELRRVAGEARETAVMRQGVTLGHVWPLYIHARRHAWSELSLRDHERAVQAGGLPRSRSNMETVSGPLFPLLSCRLSELTPEHVKAWIDKEAKDRPASVARCFRLLRACLNWCEQQDAYKGLVPANAHAAKAVRESVPAGGTKDDCLQREMLPAWFDAMRRQNNIVASAYLQTLLLTGARREELARLRWEDIDFKWQAITLADKVEKHGKRAADKDNATRTIPLTPYVSSLLQALPRRNAWVFSSASAETGRINDPNSVHARICKAAGLPHITLHGLRRSFDTLSEWVDIPVGVVAQIAGRKPSAIAEKHYKRRPLDMLRMWHVKLEAWMLTAAGIEFDADVAPTKLRVVA